MTFLYMHILPYLTGQKDYPPADPGVSNGLIAKISPTFPYKSINLSNNIIPLHSDFSVPFLPEFRWVHTPGHSPGHISLFRERDRLLIAGDAITTLKQDSAEAVLIKETDLNGPPGYFTMDWAAAESSVRLINSLRPYVVLSSHGLPMKGEKLTNQLNFLSLHFSEKVIPEHKKYVQ